MTSVSSYFCCCLFSDRNNWLSLPVTWIFITSRKSRCYHVHFSRIPLTYDMPQRRGGCPFGFVLARCYQSAGTCSPLHISVQSLHSRALPAVTNLSFLCSHSINSPDEGNDNNRESHEGHAAHHFLNSVDVISGIGQTLDNQSCGPFGLAPTIFLKCALS